MSNTHSLSEELRQRIHSARALPSPPVVTARLIELGEDPDANINQIIEVLNTDAALVARLLRLANSPLYAGRRRTENLRQAVVALGLDTVLTASLSLTLLSSQNRAGGMSAELRQRCWTRSVHAAACAQHLAAAIPGMSGAEAFLCALLQDIGVQVIERLDPSSYVGLKTSIEHSDLVAAEMRAVGADHAAVGGELLKSWGFPDRIVDAVRDSHAIEPGPLAAVAAISGWVADGINGDHRWLARALGAAKFQLDIEEETFALVIKEVMDMLPDLGLILNARAPEPAVLEEAAAELLLIRQAKAQTSTMALEKRVDELVSVTEELKVETRLDPLTGLANRRELDAVLYREFLLARQQRFPLSVLFVDFDDFKKVNDRFGHNVGDELLIQAARRIGGAVREGDFVGRYGGEEFVVVLPGADRPGAEVVAARLVDVFDRSTLRIDDEVRIAQTLSIGVATMEFASSYASVTDVVHAADQALSVAKKNGKNQWCHALGETPASPLTAEYAPTP